jgi:hypothetical protein
MVTDLETPLVERALASLAAELHRREHMLAAVGANFIEDYTDHAVAQSLPPLPPLLLAIDEFASMARELPDFITGLVNIAQRGRSLGIHWCWPRSGRRGWCRRRSAPTPTFARRAGGRPRAVADMTAPAPSIRRDLRTDAMAGGVIGVGLAVVVTGFPSGVRSSGASRDPLLRPRVRLCVPWDRARYLGTMQSVPLSRAPQTDAGLHAVAHPARAGRRRRVRRDPARADRRARRRGWLAKPVRTALSCCRAGGP